MRKRKPGRIRSRRGGGGVPLTTGVAPFSSRRQRHSFATSLPRRTGRPLATDLEWHLLTSRGVAAALPCSPNLATVRKWGRQARRALGATGRIFLKRSLLKEFFVLILILDICYEIFVFFWYLGIIKLFLRGVARFFFSYFNFGYLLSVGIWVFVWNLFFILIGYCHEIELGRH